MNQKLEILPSSLILELLENTSTLVQHSLVLQFKGMATDLVTKSFNLSVFHIWIVKEYEVFQTLF